LDGTFYRNGQKSGRDPDTGRIVIRHKGGGHQRNWRIVDKVRVPLNVEGEEPVTIRDRVIQIGYDPFRSGNIALVAGSGSNQTKLILAPEGVQVGDILTSSRGPPEKVSRMKAGDAYPIGTIPTGTMVHAIESKPGQGSSYCQAAGMYAVVTRKTETKVYARECGERKKNKQDAKEFELDPRCLAAIGMVSNPGHADLEIGKAGRTRWLNGRPKGQTGKDRWHHRKKRV